MMVIGVHVSQNFSPLLKSSATFVQNNGAFGVQLFFIVSAFTMLLTFGPQVNSRSVMAFYVRRAFRIAPLFWAAGLLYLLKDGVGPRYWAPDGLSISDVALTFGFLHWLSPHAMNAVVPGGWSIAVEMSFYVIFPVFAWLWFGLKRRNLACALMLMIYLLSQAVMKLQPDLLRGALAPEHRYIADAFFDFWLPRQMLAFGFGFLLFALTEERKLPRTALASFGASALLTPWGTTVLALFLFSYLVVSLKLEFGLATAIGQASYSIYLVHFAVIDLVLLLSRRVELAIPFELALLLVTAISLAVSALLTKPFIEDRFIRLGKAISSSIVNRPAQRQA